MLLSIVIPTKNRHATLYYAIRAALALESADVEIVVQDCSDDERTQVMVAEFISDTRLRYVKSAGSPSMTENWNLAFARVRGDYAMVLGDDDAVGKEAVRAARWARENGVDAIADERVGYFWPSYQLEQVAGTVHLPRHSGDIAFHDAMETLKYTLQRYPIDPQRLPHIYHGLVRSSLIREIKARTGAFFHSMAPDFYSTVALSCIVGRFVRAEYPLCASGVSASANAGRVHERKDYLHALEYDAREGWSSYVPSSYSMMSVIVDAAIKALVDMNHAELVPLIDFSSLYADCLVQRPTSAEAIGRAISRLLHERPSLAFVVLPRMVLRTVQMTGRKLKHLAGRRPAMRGLKKLKSRLSRVDYDVVTASNILEALEHSQKALEARGVKSPFATPPRHLSLTDE